MKNINKIFTVLMWLLIAVSVALVVVGFVTGFETGDAKAVDNLFYWTYAMLGIALVSVIVVGLILKVVNNPKSLISLAIVIVGVAAVCAVAYVLAPGAPAVGLVDQPEAQELKLTDTVLNLTYFAGAAAILSIVVGEIVMAVRNKK